MCVVAWAGGACGGGGAPSWQEQRRCVGLLALLAHTANSGDDSDDGSEESGARALVAELSALDWASIEGQTLAQWFPVRPAPAAAASHKAKQTQVTKLELSSVVEKAAVHAAAAQATFGARSNTRKHGVLGGGRGGGMAVFGGCPQGRVELTRPAGRGGQAAIKAAWLKLRAVLEADAKAGEAGVAPETAGERNALFSPGLGQHPSAVTKLDLFLLPTLPGRRIQVIPHYPFQAQFRTRFTPISHAPLVRGMHANSLPSSSSLIVAALPSSFILPSLVPSFCVTFPLIFHIFSFLFFVFLRCARLESLSGEQVSSATVWPGGVLHAKVLRLFIQLCHPRRGRAPPVRAVSHGQVLHPAPLPV